jgi:hypothetical protein
VVNSLENSSPGLWFPRAVRAMHGEATRRPANEARWLVNAHILNSTELVRPCSVATDAATKMAMGRAVNSKFEL